MKTTKSIAKRTLAVLLALVLSLGMLNLNAFAATKTDPVSTLDVTDAEYEVSLYDDSHARLNCTTPTHRHTDGCYSDWYTVCNQIEGPGHTHSDECYEPQLICGETETEGHTTHTEDCYEHEDQLSCGQEETEEHSHEDSCYETTTETICGQEESAGHSHEDSCYETTTETICGQEESVGHTHDDDCYKSVRVGEPTCNNHVHDDNCYDIIKEDQYLKNKDDVAYEAHDHDDSCYVRDLTCGKTEHVHSDTCYPQYDSSSLQSALNAPNGKVIKLGADVNMGGTTLIISTTVTLDLNGHKIIHSGAGSVIRIASGGKLTLKNSGEEGQYDTITKTVTGGAITGGKGTSGDPNNSNGTSGGGVYVGQGGTFIMEGGAIVGNEANRGGGIYAAGGDKPGQDSTLIINGGSISYNTATGKNGAGDYGGGGLWIYTKKAEIEATKGMVTIEGNVSMADGDLGGGGIYVNNTGVLSIKNAVITENTAAGLGGGLAACVHGKVSLVEDQGSIFYHNQADQDAITVNGNSYKKGDYSNIGELVDGHLYWAEGGSKLKLNAEAFRNAAQDIFSAGSKAENLTTGAITYNGISVNQKRWDDESHDWTGYELLSNSKSSFTKVSFEKIGNDYYYYGSFLTALTADGPEPNVSGNYVLIKGNTSATHGGGIGCNGTLKLGNAEDGGDRHDVEGTLKFDISKTLNNVSQKNEDFTFVLVSSLAQNATVRKTVKTDANGYVNVDYSQVIQDLINADIEAEKEVSSYTLYLKETSDSKTVKFDTTAYKIVVTLGEASSTLVVDSANNKQTRVYTHPVKSVTVQKGTVSGTTWTEEADATNETGKTPELAFTNTWKLGNLDVAKKLEDMKGPDLDKTFKFTVTLTGPEGRKIENLDSITVTGDTVSIVKKDYGKNHTEVIIIFEMKGDKTAHIEGIPAGTGYTVVETKTAAYDDTYYSDFGSIVADNTKTATVTNTRHVVDLEITKVIVPDDNGNTLGSHYGDQQGEHEFIFKVTFDGVETAWNSAEDATHSFAYTGSGVYYVKASEKESGKITGVPVGSNYTIEELEQPDFPHVVFTDEHSGEIKEDEAKNTTIGVTAKNSYFRGQINIIKTVNLDTVQFDSLGLTNTFEVYQDWLDEITDEAVHVATIVVNGDTSTTIYDDEVFKGLYEGKYTIVESEHADIDNYDWDHVELTGKGVAKSDPKKGVYHVTVSHETAENGTVTVEAENFYNRHTGNLSVNKTVTGNQGDVTKEWTFTVTLESPESYVNLETGVWNAYAYTITNSNDTVIKEGKLKFTTVDGADKGQLVRASITLKHGQTATIYGIPVGVTYTVVEAEANKDGYTTTPENTTGTITTKDETLEVKFTNYKQSPNTTKITVIKEWEDGNNKDGIRANSITVALLANGTQYKTVVLSQENEWKHTWEDLDASIKWTVEELNVPDGYDSKITPTGTNAFTITNTHTPTPDTELTVIKVWDDANDKDGLRPGSIDVQLYQDGVAYGKSVTLSEENQWKHTWTELPGGDHIYTVTEVKVPDGYTADITGNGTVITITNTHTVPNTTGLTVNKVWDDDADADGIRPSSVDVQLLADGTVIDTVTLSEANSWRHTWSNLEVGPDYSVEEVNVPDGYEDSVTNAGMVWTITNSHTPDEPDEPDVPDVPDEPNVPDLPEEDIFDIPEEDVPLADRPKKEDEDLIDIPEDEVPLTPGPDDDDELVDIEVDVPLASVPNTGDRSGLWGPLALISSAGLALLGLKNKKREKDAE